MLLGQPWAAYAAKNVAKDVAKDKVAVDTRTSSS